MPGASGQMPAIPLQARPAFNPSALDPYFQAQGLTLGLPPSSTYSLQNYIAQQQHQQQLYLQHSLPQLQGAQRSGAGLHLRGHPLNPALPPLGSYGGPGMSLGYPHMHSSPAGHMPEFNADPMGGLTRPAEHLAPPTAPPSFLGTGGFAGQEAAWRMGQQQQTTTSQEHQQRQQQVLPPAEERFSQAPASPPVCLMGLLRM